VNPVTIPNVIARKQKPPIPKSTYIPGITRPSTNQEKKLQAATAQSSDEYAVPDASDDPVKQCHLTIDMFLLIIIICVV
jgi:actin-related protein 8